MDIKNKTENSILIERIATEFARGIELLDTLSDETYTKTSYGVGSIGSHFRHNLDFANGLINGLRNGQIDYNNRERDIKVETDRTYAKERFSFLIQSIRNLSEDECIKHIEVRSELDENVWHPSSVARELEFLHSHTVHHFALIAEKLHSFEIKVSFDFGVAPSTLKYWKELEADEKAA